MTGLVSWLFPPWQSSAVGSVTRPNLADRVKEDLDEKARLEIACSIKDQTIDQLRKQLKESEQLRAQQGREMRNMSTALAKNRQDASQHATAHARLLQDNHNQRQTLAQYNQSAMTRNKQIVQRDDLLARADNDMLLLRSAVDNVTFRAQKAEAERDNLRFECEMLKCINKEIDNTTDKTKQPTESPMPPSPFAVVLVDGDGYYWSENHFLQSKHPPGAHAAHAIKSEAQRYFLANSHRVSLQSRIVTKVFCNIHGVKDRRFGHQFVSQLGEFMETFTESMPLFDYSHAGRGKERVDEKIKENFHLFISNPHCHTIFLAACHDNGFARLLEQYVCEPTARQKIVLVSPGFVIHEIADLNLSTVEWPLVFAHQQAPPGSILKARRLARLKAESEVARKNALHTELTTSIMSHVTLPDLPASPGRPTGVLRRRHTITPSTHMVEGERVETGQVVSPNVLEEVD